MSGGFEATILASRLKHAVNVLRRIDDEAILNIGVDGFMCRLMDPANALMVQINIPDAVIEAYKPRDMQVGINLNKLKGILNRAAGKAAKDMIHISGDMESWQIVRGIHQNTMQLLDTSLLRKTPKCPTIPHTAAVHLTGAEFKDVVNAALGTPNCDHVVVHATADEATIGNGRDNTKRDTYKAVLPADRVLRYNNIDTVGTYSLLYLPDIAEGMNVDDAVQFSFATNKPCEIVYERDGVKVVHILAAHMPHIESD